MTGNVDWRARIAATFKAQLDTPEAKMALAIFKTAATAAVRRAVSTGASNLLIAAVAAPAIRAAYAQLLYRLGVPYKEPSPDFVLQLIDDIVDEVRSRRGS